MDRFIQGATVWPEGWTRLHVYVLPDLDRDAGLRGLIEAARGVMAEFAEAITPVPDVWLHATGHMMTAMPAAEVSGEQRGALVAALGEELAGVRPFRLKAGSVLAGGSGVYADLDGDLVGQPFHLLYTKVRAAFGQVFGDGSIEYDAMPPHLTLGYAHGPADSGRVQSALRRRCRPNRAPSTADAVLRGPDAIECHLSRAQQAQSHGVTGRNKVRPSGPAPTEQRTAVSAGWCRGIAWLIR